VPSPGWHPWLEAAGTKQGAPGARFIALPADSVPSPRSVTRWAAPNWRLGIVRAQRQPTCCRRARRFDPQQPESVVLVQPSRETPVSERRRARLENGGLTAAAETSVTIRRPVAGQRGALETGGAVRTRHSDSRHGTPPAGTRAHPPLTGTAARLESGLSPFPIHLAAAWASRKTIGSEDLGTCPPRSETSSEV
jgi:hypothetical protein